MGDKSLQLLVPFPALLCLGKMHFKVSEWEGFHERWMGAANCTPQTPP